MMKKISCLLFLITIFLAVVAQQKFQLAPPVMKYSSVFFTDKVKIILSFAQPGTTIHYTTNGTEPDEHSPVYQKPVVIKNNFTTLKAKTFGTEFLSSETVQATFVKDGLPLKRVDYPAPNEKYTGQGPSTLMDNKGGNLAFASKTWLGFKQDTVTITITLDKKRKVSSILFNVLQEQGSWIFFPHKAEVYITGGNSGPAVKRAEMLIVPAENVDVNTCRPFIIHLKKKIKTDNIRLELYLLKQIPDWHPGKGQPSWIFIDEVKLY